MFFTEEAIKNPELIELDPVNIAFMDDPDFQNQVMGTFQYGDEILADTETDVDEDLLDDSLCGDSIDVLDVEADDYVDMYNNGINDDDGELIDMAIGSHPYM